MSKTQAGIVSAMVIVLITVPAIVAHRSQLKLRAENQALREDLAFVPRLSADNQRLSNVVAQAKVALINADDRYQELIKLRAEVSRLTQENQATNRVDQVKLAQLASDQLREMVTLRNDVAAMSKQISLMREELRNIPAAAASPAPAESPAAAAPASAPSPTERVAVPAQNGEDQPLTIRMIDTQGESFAEKLKRSVAAQDNETFQEVYARFLQANGINLTSVAGFGFNERTGRVIVRAPKAILDQIERVTVALDRAE